MEGPLVTPLGGDTLHPTPAGKAQGAGSQQDFPWAAEQAGRRDGITRSHKSTGGSWSS